MFTVYVLRNGLSGKIYIGQTNNYEKRVLQHNDTSFDKRSYTSENKGKGNWILVYKEEFQTREVARTREKQLKSSRGRAFIFACRTPRTISPRMNARKRIHTFEG